MRGTHPLSVQVQGGPETARETLKNTFPSRRTYPQPVTWLPMVDAAVEELVDGVLASVPAPLREACDRAGILQGLGELGACDLGTLGSMLDEDYAEVKAAVIDASKPAFVATLKAAIREANRGCDAPSTSSTQQHSSAAELVSGIPSHKIPLVVTVKFNGAVIAERTSISVSASTTFAELARTRLEAVKDETCLNEVPLSVSLFRNADQQASDRVAAAITDQVGPPFALGYPFVLLSFTAPVHGCAPRPTGGANPFATGSFNPFNRAKGAGTLVLPEPYTPKEEGGSLSFELALFNAVLAQCTEEKLGVEASDRDACAALLLNVRDAVWLMSGRERSFKMSKVRTGSFSLPMSYACACDEHFITWMLACRCRPDSKCTARRSSRAALA